MNHRIKLFRQPCIEVMTEPLGVRSVDYADGAFEKRPSQTFFHVFVLKQQKKSRQIGFMNKQLVTVFERHADIFSFRRRVPVASRSHSPGASREIDQSRPAPVFLTHK